MKDFIKKICLMLPIVLTFISCNKDFKDSSQVIPDYRDKFIGNYYFINIKQTYLNLGDTTHIDSITSYHGNVGYGLDTNQIAINYYKYGRAEMVILYHNGSFNKLPNQGNGFNFYGQFLSSDSLICDYDYYAVPNGWIKIITCGKRE